MLVLGLQTSTNKGKTEVAEKEVVQPYIPDNFRFGHQQPTDDLPKFLEPETATTVEGGRAMSAVAPIKPDNQVRVYSAEEAQGILGRLLE